MKASENPDLQWIGEPGVDTAMMIQVQSWLDAGMTLIWHPIYDRENFPKVSPRMLELAWRWCDFSCLVNAVEDFMGLPNGIKGWLMPVDADDTDVVCARWEDGIYFMGVADRRTGKRVTYRDAQQEPVDDDPKSKTSSQMGATPS